MDPVTLGFAVAGASTVVSGLVGAYNDAKARGDQRKADQLRRQLMAEASRLPEPVLQELSLQEPEFAGLVGYVAAPDQIKYEGYNPTLAQQERIGPSAYDKISANPQLRSAQLAALDELSNIADSGGMTAVDKANLARIQGDVAQSNRGRQEAILQSRAARGMGGSGDELLAQLTGSQAATNRQAQAGLDIAGMAQQRALDAILQRGNLAGGLRSQDYSEAARRAEAADAIARFNAQNSMAMSQYNAGAQTAAAADRAKGQYGADQFNTQMGFDAARLNRDIQSGNLGRQQRFYDQRAANRNEEARYNIQNPQRQFDNAMAKQSARNAAGAGVAGGYERGADRQRQTGRQQSDAIQKAGTAYADYLAKRKPDDED